MKKSLAVLCFHFSLAKVAKRLIRVLVPTSLDELKAAIAGGKALLVCGAGVSRAVAGGAAPGWKGLIESAIDEAPKKPGEDWSAHCKESLSRNDPDVWLSAADIAQGKLGGCTGNQYRRWLKKSVGRLKVAERALLDAIKALNCRLATTNYDSLLCDHIGVQPNSWRNPDAVAEILKGETRHVWHIHGFWDDRESVIFSNADYVRVGNSELAQFLQRSAAFTDTLIFIGCSADGLADKNVGKLLDWFGKSWAGLGENHFALVADGEMSAPGWPPAVTRVPYGPTHEALPDFLRSLAVVAAPPPASGPAPDSVNSIEFIIPDTPTIGRLNEIARVVLAALDRRPCIVTGAPGMGKSKIALAAAYDPQVIDRFGQRRVAVSLENRSDPLDLLILLADELGLTTEPLQSTTLTAIQRACGLAPAFAILDNAEVLIDANERETGRLLGFLRNVPGLSFVVTSRESLPGLIGWERIDDLPPLPLEEARALFRGIATSIHPRDPDLEPLLRALDGHALSLTIVAGRVDADTRLQPMLERWNREKADLLRQPGATQDRRTSVRASLRLSLTSRHMTPMAKRLLSVLGFLPDGLPAGGLRAFLGREDQEITAQKSDAATEALRRLRLIPPRADGSLKLLNPLRECVVIERPLKSPDLEWVLNAGLKLLEKGKCWGTDSWPAARPEVLPHIGNFAPIIIAAGRTRPITDIGPVIELARRLAFNESRFERTAFLELARLVGNRRTKDSEKVAAAALLAAGDLARRRDDLDGAKTHLEAARKISVRIGDSLGEANARRSLGDLARWRDDLAGARSELEAARDISVNISDSLGKARALHALGDLALRRADLDGAKTHLEAARKISVRIGDSLGQANALLFLGDLARQRDDLDGAKTRLKAARAIYVRIGASLGEANTAFVEALTSTREDMAKAEAMFDNALKKYEALNEAWGMAHSSLRLAQIRAIRGNSTSLPAAAAKVVEYETSDPSKRAGPGWRAFCASLTETDPAMREALRDKARAAWTGIGALGLVREYLDFRIELNP